MNDPATCKHKTVLEGICQYCGRRLDAPLSPGVLARFDGVCTSLECNPHDHTDFGVTITRHRPEDDDDKEHRRHHRAAAALDMTLSATQMRHFVPGKRYIVTVTEVDE